MTYIRTNTFLRKAFQMFRFLPEAFDPRTTLGPCGTFPYGYVGEQVKPCIYIKLNKIWGWRPRPTQCENYYPYNDCPESLRNHLNSPAAKEAGEENVWIDCNGRSVKTVVCMAGLSVMGIFFLQERS